MPPRKKQALTAAVNLIGPDGSLCEAETEIPQEWLDHADVDVDHLVASGGAKKKG